MTHNHRVGAEILSHYPSSRRLSQPEQEEVMAILSLHPNNKHLKEMIRKKFGKLTTLKDIQNLKAKVKEKARHGLQDAQLLLDCLQEALDRDKAARGGLIVNEDHVLELFYFQSGHMRKLFGKFPEILLVDGTYNVNGQGMPLYCIMAEDGYGHGRVVFFAATTEEDASHLQKIFQSFKDENSAWQSVRVIIVDKDFSEWKVLREEFPSATVLFCQWHVIKAMFKHIADCGIEKSMRDKARETIKCLVYAKDESEYDQLKEELFEATNAKFKKYFLANWESYQEMWVTFKRDKYVHFGNTTNNRLESNNQKLKDVTTRTSTLSEMFQNVLLFARTCESEYKHSSFTEEFTTASVVGNTLIDECVPEIKSACTQYAAAMLVDQLKIAHSVDYQVLVAKNEGMEMLEVQSPNGSLHMVNQCSEMGSVCSCSFHKTMCLPCRHMFAVQMHQKRPLFDSKMIVARWQKQYQLLEIPMEDDIHHDPDDNKQDMQVLSMNNNSVSLLKNTLTQTQKYRKMQTLCQKLAAMASLCGMAEFREKYAEVNLLINYWESNTQFVFAPTEDKFNMDLSVKPTSFSTQPPIEQPPDAGSEPVNHLSNTGPISHSSDTRPIHHTLDAGPSHHSSDTGTIHHSSNTGSIHHLSDTGAISHSSDTGPIHHTLDTGPSHHSSDTGPIVHHTLDAEPGHHSSNTGPVNHLSNTGPISHSSDTGPIHHTLDAGPSHHSSDTGTIHHSSNTGSIHHLSDTGAISHSSDTGPIHHTLDTGPSHHSSDTGPIVHHTLDAEPGHHSSNTGPVNHLSNTGPISHSSDTGPIHHTLDAGPSHHSSDTGTIHHSSNTGSIHHLSDTGAISHSSDTGPIHHTLDTGPSHHSSDTGPIVHHTLDAEPGHHSSNTGPVNHLSNTGPISHSSDTGPIHHTLDAGPSHHSSDTGTIHHSSNTGLIHHPSDTEPIHHTLDAGPSHHSSDTGTIHYSSNTGPIHHSIDTGLIHHPSETGPVHHPSDTGPVYHPSDTGPIDHSSGTQVCIYMHIVHPCHVCMA